MTNAELIAQAEQMEQDAKRIKDLITDEETISMLLASIPDLSVISEFSLKLQGTVLVFTVKVGDTKQATFKSIDYRFDENTVTPMIQIMFEAMLEKANTLIDNKKDEIITLLGS